MRSPLSSFPLRPPKFTQHVGTERKTSRLPVLKRQRSELQAASNCGERFHLNAGAKRPACSPGARAEPCPAHPARHARALGDNWKERMLGRHPTLARRCARRQGGQGQPARPAGPGQDLTATRARVMPESQPYTRSLSHTPEQRAKTKETRPTAERPQDQLNHLKNRAKHSSEEER